MGRKSLRSPLCGGVKALKPYPLSAGDELFRPVPTAIPYFARVPPKPYTLHPKPYTLNLTPCTLHPKPYTLNPTP
ncbi:hypothetical protein T484DRAFT_1613176 [Baffinella frigidus]|nr:hypothetical protein T484DRAFT_1613176 [Cryptophyta sp. CCMP2293]